MAQALALAEQGRSGAWPNPMVGAVVVDPSGAILGKGYHRRCGEPHAEVNAINAVANQELLKNATLYVTLEPCSHHGKTPPCAELIVSKGIPRVVVGVLDPNEKVAGRGIELLKQNGIEVAVGVLEEECRELNADFFAVHAQKRPYIVLKWAQSSDGFLDAVRRKGTAPAWMTSPEAKRTVHRWRAGCDAIVVGRRTVEMDNPSLTAREVDPTPPFDQPLRVVFDRQLQLHPMHNVFDAEAPTLIFTQHEGKAAHAATHVLDYSGDTLTQAIEELFRRGVGRILVEGGGQLLDSFIQAKLWDEARIFTAARPIASYYPDLYVEMGIAAPKIEGREVSVDPTLGLRILKRK